MRWVGSVPSVEEKYRQSCGWETGTIILGRCTTKCRIILKWKKYEMRAWIGFMWLKIGTAQAFFLHYSDNCGCTRNRKTCLVAEELIYIKKKRDSAWRYV